MADDTLLNAAGRIADGEQLDWGSITSSLPSDDERAVAEELAVVAQIAAGHRQLHQLLPVAADTPPNLMPDRARWGHLDLLNIVGRGSYGTVYRAWDTRLERLVALKLFHGASDPDAVMQEGRMLARVRHEHFVSVYGADVIDGVAGLWMELVHGETLDHLVRTRGPMTAVEAATLGADVAAAIGAVHAAGLLHCDVKAQNVVQEGGGRVVLMDLGAGRVVPEAQDSDQLSDVAGTPRYMAPELFQAGAVATKSTDIYSFGVLLYYLVSARFPVDGKSLGALKQAHFEKRFIALHDVGMGLPAAFLDIVARATDRDPAQRPASAGELQSVLAEIAAPMAATKPRSVGWWAAVAAAVALLALVVARPLFTPAAPPAPEVRSIAVLPIKNLTGDPSKLYVADGLTEVLISNLARIRSFRVQSFAAVVPYRETPDGTSDIAAKLGVELLLAGSVTQFDSQIRVTVTLIEGATGVALWSEELSRGPAGLLTGQAQLIRNMASSLGIRMADREQNALQAKLDSNAEDAYLRGLARSLRAPAEPEQTVADFRTVTQLAPEFAPAWAELALAELFTIDHVPYAQRSERTENIRQFANRAIDLDSQLPRGYAARGLVELYLDWDFAAAEQTFRTAIGVAPHDGLILQRLAMLLAARGRLDEAIQFAQEARAIEPTVPSRSTALATVYYYARDFRRAEQEYRRALTIDPSSAVAHFGLGRVFADEGRAGEALVEIERALSQVRSPAWLAEYARVLILAKRPEEAQQVIAELTAGTSQPFLDQWAHIALAQGDVERAFAVLDRAVAERSNTVLWLAVDPRVDALRTDPRFDKLLTQIGLR